MITMNVFIYRIVFAYVLFIKLGLSYIQLNYVNHRLLLNTKNHKIHRTNNFPINSISTNTLLYSSSKDINSIDDRANELRDLLKGTCIFFVGMMGSGKSTIGNAFAKKLGYRFLDTDEIAEYMIEMPIAEFFAQGKEADFRELEYKILMQMVQYTRVVISTGGGIVMKKENWGCLHHGIIVFLDLSPEVIYERLIADPSQVAKRPLLATPDPLAKLRSLREERIGKYNAADICISVPPEYNAEEVADLAIESILSHIANNPPLWKTWKQQRDQKNLGTNNDGSNSNSLYDDMIRSAGDASIMGSNVIQPNNDNQIPTNKL